MEKLYCEQGRCETLTLVIAYVACAGDEARLVWKINRGHKLCSRCVTEAVTFYIDVISKGCNMSLMISSRSRLSITSVKTQLNAPVTLVQEYDDYSLAQLPSNSFFPSNQTLRDSESVESAITKSLGYVPS